RLQKIADPAFLARVFSIREMGTAAAYSLGCLVVGYAAEKAGSSAVSWGLAGWGVAAGLLWLLVKKPAVSKQIDVQD
ncbi:hypothetical protein MXD63_44510, partial [Frankia sp. Cpl3]|nr:hypothetical protein [Frankia sp. Cpl3]